MYSYMNLFLFIITTNIFALSFAQENEVAQCPEGQVFDVEIGACISEQNGVIPSEKATPEAPEIKE